MRDLVMKAKGGSEREKKRVVQVKYRERDFTISAHLQVPIKSPASSC